MQILWVLIRIVSTFLGDSIDIRNICLINLYHSLVLRKWALTFHANFLLGRKFA